MPLPLRSITNQQWLTLFAAQAGYMLDAMDVLLFIFAVNVIRDEFHLSAAQAGLVSSFTLASSAIGGIGFGILSDRIGRAKSLIWSIVIFSVASAGTALSWNLPSLLFWRAVIGIGLGAEWSAGAVLVAETWPAEHRAKAVGIMQSGWALGYLLAAGMTALILPRWGWKALFVAGIFPALLALALRRKLREPEIWLKGAHRPRVSALGIFRGLLLRRTVLASALATSVLFAYWGLFTWIPGFLSASRARGGAGLSIVRTSGFIVPMQMGAFAGYVAFGWLADKIGRRPAFVLYVAGAALLTPIYGASQNQRTLLLLGPAIGFSRHRVLQPVRRHAGRAVSDTDPWRGSRVRLQPGKRPEFPRAVDRGILCGPLGDRRVAGAELRFFPVGSRPDFYAARNEAGRPGRRLTLHPCRYEWYFIKGRIKLLFGSACEVLQSRGLHGAHGLHKCKTPPRERGLQIYRSRKGDQK